MRANYFIIIGLLVLLTGCYINNMSDQSVQRTAILGEYEIDATTNPCFSYYDTISKRTFHGCPSSYTKRIKLSENHKMGYYNAVQNDSPILYRDKEGKEIIYTRNGVWKIESDTLILNFQSTSDARVEYYLIRPDSLISVNQPKKTIWVKDL